MRTITKIFDRVRNIFSSQENQILRDLFSREIKMFLTRSKLNLIASSPLLSNQPKISIKYTVFDLGYYIDQRFSILSQNDFKPHVFGSALKKPKLTGKLTNRERTNENRAARNALDQLYVK